MTSVRPYLVRALLDWIVDNDLTPHLVIDCRVAGAEAPSERAQDGKLVLNISAAATRNFALDDGWLDVDCRFGGAPMHVRAPVGAIIAVYARENGMGMGFEVEESAAGQPQPESPPPRSGGPKLTVVK